MSIEKDGGEFKGRGLTVAKPTWYPAGTFGSAAMSWAVAWLRKGRDRAARREMVNMLKAE